MHEWFRRSSSGRVTTMAPSSLRATAMGSATSSVSAPFGPLTQRLRPSIVTSTPVNEDPLLTNT